MARDRLIVRPGRDADIAERNTENAGEFRGKKRAKKFLEKKKAQIARLQNALFAQKQHGVVIVFQAMDAAGKDSAIKEIFEAVDPHGCHVTSFGRPSEEEMSHDFLWRHGRYLPRRGHMAVFNRSYYEELIVVRVHGDLLVKQNLPPEALLDIWHGRFTDINAHEAYLARNGIIVIKFFLHISKDEQKARFLERLTRPEKNYKFSAGDMKERECWDKYMKAYEKMLTATSTPHAPWYVIPSDHKWNARALIADIIVKRLRALNPHYPVLDREQRKDLLVLREDLQLED